MGSPLFYMASKLSQCRQSLKEWSKLTVGNSRQELEQLQHELQTLQLEEQTEMTLSRQEFLIDRINHLWRQDEAYWFQRARTNWIQFGDKNSKFFHAIASRRRQNNYIFQLKDEHKNWVEDNAPLLAHAPLPFSKCLWL
ncbi:hypothetical protein SLA2020_210370 [Shorea laevis]